MPPAIPEPITPSPSRPVARAVMLQRWNDISWLHWSYPPAVVEALLPAGLQVDTFEGQAWVGLVPFRMTRVRPPFLPPLPWVGTFPEINVRTYVVTPDGRRAVWFWSLEATRSPAVVTARIAFGLPYYWAGAGIERSGDRVHYWSKRRWPHGPASTAITVEAGEALDPADTTDLEHFLTARFGLVAQRRGGLYHGAVEHPAWSLRRAGVLRLDDGLLAAAGLPDPEGDPLVHSADGVPVRISRLEPLRA